MVTEKKPSIYSDRSTIGSADELDEYGVWVKSGPQDLPAGIAGEEFADLSMPDFDTDFGDESLDADMSLPDISDIDFSRAEAEIADTAGDVPASAAEDEFDVSFDDLGIPEEEPADGFSTEEFGEEPASEESGDLGLSGLEDVPGGWDLAEIPDEIDETGEESLAIEEDFPPEEGPVLKTEDSAPDLSTRLLMKIADELESIRNELSTLKQDFALVRSEAPAEEKAGLTPHGGFFSEEDDEKIALTGDELDHILNTADFTGEGGKVGEHDIAVSLSEDPEDDLSLRKKTDSEISFTDVADDLSTDLITEDAGFEEEPAAGEEPAEADAETEEPDASGGEEEEEEGEEEEEIEIDFDDLNIDLDISPDDFDKAREEKAPEENSLADMALDLAAEDFAVNDFAAPENESLMAEENLPDESQPEENLLTETGEIDLGGEMEDSGVLRDLRSSGVEVMEPPPEETTYLEDDPLAAEMNEDVFDVDISLDEDFEAASLDLSAAVIDEPDLSAGITENPVEEPSLDDISLDGIEDITIELEDEQLESAAEESMYEEPELPVPQKEDIETPELSLTDKDNTLAQVIPEGFEAGAGETPASFDDDLETAFADDASVAAEAAPDKSTGETLDIPPGLKTELKTVLSYMDHLLESLPEEKIEEFAKSEYFDAYRKLFKELGLA
ncbi:MAG: hypothetical protein LBG57_01045 [Treponema sp.]|jgi:hypothetical protein|nr:hypothetical protein [Treponema sp.]